MALIDCSECGHKVSDKAAACPQCGNPILTTTPTSSADPQEQGFSSLRFERPASKVKVESTGIGSRLFGLFGLGVLAYVAFTFVWPLVQGVSGADGGLLGRSAADTRINEAIYILQTKMRTPSTFSLVDGAVVWEATMKDGRPAYVVKLNYDFQNLHGAVERDCALVAFVKPSKSDKSVNWNKEKSVNIGCYDAIGGEAGLIEEFKSYNFKGMLATETSGSSGANQPVASAQEPVVETSPAGGSDETAASAVVAEEPSARLSPEEAGQRAADDAVASAEAAAAAAMDDADPADAAQEAADRAEQAAAAATNRDSRFN